MDDLQNKLNEIVPHKLGNEVYINDLPKDKYNKWVIHEILIGGYKIKSLYDNSVIKILTERVSHFTVKMNEIEGHLGHSVVKSFVSNPKFDSYLYCRDCKEEVTSKYKVEGFDV